MAIVQKLCKANVALGHFCVRCCPCRRVTFAVKILLTMRDSSVAAAVVVELHKLENSFASKY